MVFSLVANSLALAALLIMLASGLALIYGLRDVMNFGHGAIYMLGAYLGYTVSQFADFWVALVAVPVILAGVGIVFEYLVLRPLQNRPHIEVALITFGLGIIVAQGLTSIYGGAALTVNPPTGLTGSIDLFGIDYPAYRFFLIVVGLGLCVALAAWLNLSKTGMYVRATSRDPSVARMMGVNASRLSLLVSCLSLAFAGIAGVLAGPYLSVDPGMDVAMMVTCLIIVVVGGTGSIAGAIVAAVLYGFVQVAGTVFLPTVAPMVPYALLMAILLFRPQGIGLGHGH